MSSPTGREAITYLCNHSWNASRLGLERTRELLQRVGNPHKNLRFVHIAGTNGKGSTAAITASILRAAGYRTGLYTSPYIHTFHERMQIDGVPIADDELMRLTELIRPHAEEMKDHPTEFELITALAFLYFLHGRCDIVVLEVGLGGRLDSTNVVEAPEVSVITAIGLDHTAELGNTLEEIAGEKSGIIKQRRPVVLYQQSASVEHVFEEVCLQKNAPLHKVDFDALHSISHDLTGQVFDFGALHGLKIPLLGAHQLKNAAVSLTTAMVLRQHNWKIPDTALIQGLATVHWPGRFELICQSPLFLVDGGHNPQCIQTVVESLHDYVPNRKAVFLVGVLSDKDYPAMMELLAPYAMSFVAVSPHSPRALPASELANFLAHYALPVECCESIELGVQRACEIAQPNGLVCALGSLYMTGAIRSCFGLF